MAELPVVSGREARAAFERLGWGFKRQKGSHMILVKPGHVASLSIPDHRELAPGTLRGLLRAAGTRVDEFRAALRLARARALGLSRAPRRVGRPGLLALGRDQLGEADRARRRTARAQLLLLARLDEEAQVGLDEARGGHDVVGGGSVALAMEQPQRERLPAGAGMEHHERRRMLGRPAAPGTWRSKSAGRA